MRIKYLLCGLLSVLVLVISVGYILHHQELNLRCESEINHKIVTQDSDVTLDASATLFLLDTGKGFINLYGSLLGSENVYPLNRKIHFTYQRDRMKGVYDVRITGTDIRTSLDQAPEALMKYIYSSDFYLEIVRLGKNGYFLKGLSTPFLVCYQP